MRTNNKPLVISLLAHAACLLTISLISRQPAQQTPGDAEQQVIRSRLVMAEPAAAILPVSTKHATLRLPAHTAAASAAPAPQSAGTPAPSSALLAMLHAAIEREQQYPASAQELAREGRTTLAFTLFPDGRIRNLRIAQSSGTAALDAAALAAVNAAAPFQHIEQFLQNAGQFQVDVVFELTV